MTVTNSRAQSAFVSHDLKTALKGSERGPLAGLNAAVKDMYDIAGERAGGGNPCWLKDAMPAARTAPAVQKILDAGATVIGKTICDEFFFSLMGVNQHYGAPVNPRAPNRVAGGSSSGSASATASGACDFALGSDTGGSIRVPAAFCGLYGIRPTHGRVNLAGVMPMAPSFDVCGWFASGPGVFRQVGSVLLGQERDSHKIDNVIILDDAFALADLECRALFDVALHVMRHELPALRHGTLATEKFHEWSETFRVLQGHEVWNIYGEYISRAAPILAPDIQERFRFASQVTDKQAERARETRGAAREFVEAIVKPGTVLMLPTSPSVAPELDSSPDTLQDFRARLLRLTCISGLTGLPQITVPVGAIAGAPIGLSFMGWRGGDEALLDLAARISRFCGIES